MKKLGKILLFFALTVVFAFSSAAQILFKVEKPGSTKTSYLLGTHHVAPLSVVDSISELPAILENIDKLYGEVDMELLNNPMELLKMQKSFVAPSDSMMENLLTSAQLDSVRAVWNEYAGELISFEFMSNMKPAYITTHIGVAMSERTFPQLNPMEGIDDTMQKRARELGKPVEGLETVEFQINMLFNQPIEKQIDELLDLIRNTDEIMEKTKETSEAYLAHDLEKINELMNDEDGDPEKRERMNFSRNDTWVEKLAEEMPQQSLMVVVGAGHLPGERGVIEGLRKAGFIVTPLN